MPARKRVKEFLFGKSPRGPSPSPSRPASRGPFERNTLKAAFSHDKSSRGPSPTPAGSGSSHAPSGLPSITAPADTSVVVPVASIGKKITSDSESAFAPVGLPPASNHNPTDTQLAGDTTASSSALPRSSNVVNQSPIAPVPSKSEAFYNAIQEFVNNLPDDDKTAFQSSSDIMEKLREMQRGQNSHISSPLTSRVQKVLQLVKHFMGFIAMFTQYSPGISSLVVGGANCILTVSIVVLIY